MKSIEQKVEVYSGLNEAKMRMTQEIENGWEVYQCVTFNAHFDSDKVLVVYKNYMVAD